MICAALAAPVQQHDDGSASNMHDLTIVYPGGRLGAVEVTACADPKCIETWEAMNGNDEVWQFDGLRGGWVVSAYPSARVRLLRQRLPAILRQLESRGVTRICSARSSSTSSQTEVEQLRRLHVVDAFQGQGTDRPGSVYLTIDGPAQAGGIVPGNGDVIAEWIGDFLREHCQTKLDKLQRSGSSERHMFVFVPGFTSAPWPVRCLLMLSPVPLPTIAPTLPPEVTHAWVASTWSTSTGLSWCRSAGWQHFSKSVS